MLLFVFSSILAVLLAVRVKQTKNYNWLLASLSVIVFIMSFQDSIAQDFPVYVSYFDEIMAGYVNPAGFLKTREPFQTIEMGWWFLNSFVGSIIPSYYAVNFVVSLIVCSSLYRLLKRVPVEYIWLSIFYFYYSTMLFFMSGARQAVSVALFVHFILYFIDKKYVLSVIFFILGCTFHNTMLFGLFFIPLLYFKEINSKNGRKLLSLLFVILFVSSFIFGDFIQSAILSSISSTLDDFDYYSGHLGGLKTSPFTLNNILSRSFIFLFSLYAFFNTKGFYRFLSLSYLVTQILDVLLGHSGEIGRLSYYGIIFATPLMAVIPNVVNRSIHKSVFIVGLLFVVVWQFISSVMTNFLYEGYINYRTIFF